MANKQVCIQKLQLLLRKGKSFEVIYRKAESKEEVKTAIDSLEKDALLLDLIPIALNKELESTVLTQSLLIETPNSINIIWDFIIISFRFYGEPEGLFKLLFCRVQKTG